MSSPLPGCAHCGLPVPPGLVEDEAELQFCCSGCRVAFEVIRGHGLERYYDLRERLEAPEQPARATGGGYAEFDDPTFHALYLRPAAGDLATVELYLEGVHCAACVWLVEKVPSVVPGVAECRLDLGRSLASVRFDPAVTPLSTVARFLDSIGYAPHPYHGVEQRAMERREERALLIRIAVAGAIAGNVMLLAFALYGGHFHGIEPAFEKLFRGLSAVLAAPAVLWCAAPFYRGTIAALRTRSLHMDVPIAVGILAGSAWGLRNIVAGAGEIYFDSVTVLIFLLLAGRFVQRRQQRAAARSTELLFSLAPQTARRLGDDGLREVPVAALAAGDRVEVRAGDSIPADGVVVAGASELDLALLTGESAPVAVRPGDPVHAGTVNVAARLEVEVRSTGADTRVGRLLALVEEASRRRAPVIRLADRISGWFVAAVLVLAAATALLWWRLEPELAVEHAVALLIVSCPCALGLATPLAVAAALGQAARRGLLVKGGDALEALARPSRMVLDKTGTLTEGRLAVVRWLGDEAVRSAVAALESGSSHPVARALSADPPPAAVVADVRQEPGRGVAGRVDGRLLLVGSPAWVAERTGELDPEWQGAVESLLAEGLTPVLVAVDGRPAAAVGLGDPPRSDARRVLETLAGAGWRLEVLSGDHPRVVRALLDRLAVPEIEGTGGATPEAKAHRVQTLAAEGPVVMVGDGVNDAAALAAATVGIGVHGGAEATLAAADAYLGRPGLESLAELISGARRTLAVIRRNLVLSLAYNVVAVSLAIAGLMHPLVAAVLMPLSSITVVASSYRARIFPAPDA